MLEVAVTTGEVNEAPCAGSQIDAVAALTEEAILTVTADADYAVVYGALKRRGICP